jgi:hypothetical protein
MPNMGKTSKRQVAIRLDLHLCRAVEKKYRFEDDTTDVVAYVRALEDATRDVILTSEDYEMIAAQVAKNEAKRKSSK